MGTIPRQLLTLNGTWHIAKDADNVGKREAWHTAGPVADAKETHVPSVLEETFHDYDGVVWYWRRFDLPALDPGRRALLHFRAADYYSEVWLNSEPVGDHEGGNAPFRFDITSQMRSSEENQLVVRLINPGETAIDGYEMRFVPHNHRRANWRASDNRFHNFGGIWQDVEVEIVPQIRIDDVFAAASVSMATVGARVALHNAGPSAERVKVRLAVSPSFGGSTVAVWEDDLDVAPGQSTVATTLPAPGPELWSPEHPVLYTLGVSLTAGGDTLDETSTRFGFREFTVSGGYFRLNGKRLIVRSNHVLGNQPGGLAYPTDGDLLRQELMHMKRIGLNMVRSLGRSLIPPQLDICDEIGLMVYEETPAAWQWEDSPDMARRFDGEVREMVLRDRNHASVVIWGLLNETRVSDRFHHARQMPAMVRELDQTRMIALNSGTWQESGESFCLPGQTEWDDQIEDAHIYRTWPLTEGHQREYRERGDVDHRLFLSEFGFGSALDTARTLCEFDQMGVPRDNDDAHLYELLHEQVVADFPRLGMDAIWPTTNEFCRESRQRQADSVKLALDLVYANPNLAGCSYTSFCDETMNGRGVFSICRSPKFPVVTVHEEGQKPLRWSVFATPASVYAGSRVTLEAVLRNEDVLAPGSHPARLLVDGPGGVIFERSGTVVAPERGVDADCVLPVFSEELTVGGSPGPYDVIVQLEEGGAARGTARFIVSEATEPVAAGTSAVAWGLDERQTGWLAAQGVDVTPYDPASLADGPVAFLVGSPELTGEGLDAYATLLERVDGGSVAVFLSPQRFVADSSSSGDAPAVPFPVPNAGEVRTIGGRASWGSVDHFLKEHPISAGMPANTLLDSLYYREVYPSVSLQGLPEGELIAGCMNVGSVGGHIGYWSAKDIVLFDRGAGKVLVSTYRLLDSIGHDPAADRLLANMLTFACHELLA